MNTGATVRTSTCADVCGLNDTRLQYFIATMSLQTNNTELMTKHRVRTYCTYCWTANVTVLHDTVYLSLTLLSY